jgi:hypothetical protein
VGFELTLGRLVGSVGPETTPATVGGEEGGGRPLRSQCQRPGGSAGQCTRTGGSKGCGWRLMWSLGSRWDGGQWGAPASFGRQRRRALRGGSVMRPGECEGGGARGVTGGPIGAHARQLAWPAGPRRMASDGGRIARLGQRQRVRGVWARGHGPGHDCRRVIHAVTVGGVGLVRAPARRQRRDVACRACSGVPTHFQFDVASFDRFKLNNFELKFKFAKYESCRPDNPLQLS